MDRTLLILILMALSTAPVAAQERPVEEAPKVPLATARANAKGNELVREGEFEAAAIIYRDEALKRPENGILQRNLAGALVRSNQGEEGLAAYGQALRFAETRQDKAAALYDLGNALTTGGQLEPALQTYVTAMMLTPEDMDIRHNYEYVLQLLQEQQQQEQQQSPNDEEQDGDQEGERQPQPDPGQEGQEEKPREGEQEQQQEEQQNPAEQQELQPAEPEDGEAMDPEDAKRLLDAMLEEEKELQAERSKQIQPRNPNVEKDW